MKLFAPLALTFASCVAILSHSPEAAACGGCFHGVQEANPSVVTGHRMALSISPTQTVLWDQVEYAGDPTEFAWVLPVGPGAYIEEADDAFFEALEAVTSTRVMSSVFFCDAMSVQQQESSAGGCGSSNLAMVPTQDAPTDPEQQGDVRGVTVLHEGTVGPYETATIQSADPQALRTWLTTNNYAIPADIDPVIDAYVAEGSAFIALRLSPGVGVRQMTPVRVITPGASNILPLRMVAAGTGASVSVVLYVIGEGRYQAAGGRPNTTIGPNDLTWNWALQRSDYTTVRDDRLADGTWLTSFSKRGGMFEPVMTTDGSFADYDVVWNTTGAVDTYDNLVDLYFGRSAVTDGIPLSCDHVRETLVGAPDGASVVAGCDPADPNCVAPPEGSIVADDLSCEGHGDIGAALLGMHPADVWVTRLEANLPREALAEDLMIGAEMTQEPVTNWMIAGNDENMPTCNTGTQQPQANPTLDDEGSGGLGCGCSTKRSRFFDPTAAVMAVAALLLGARRVSRRG